MAYPNEYYPSLEEKQKAAREIEEAAARGREISDAGGVPLFTNVPGHTEEGTVYIPQKTMQTYGKSSIPPPAPPQPTPEQMEYVSALEEGETVVKQFHPIYSQKEPETPQEQNNYWNEVGNVAKMIMAAKKEQRKAAEQEAKEKKEAPKISDVDNKKFSMLEKDLAKVDEELKYTPPRGETQTDYNKLLKRKIEIKQSMDNILKKYEPKTEESVKTVTINGKQYKDGDIIEKDGKRFIVRVK